MTSNEYHFVTEWQFRAPVELIFKILENGAEFPRWWPEVYLAARAEKSGRVDRIDDKIHFHTRGWLPYTLKWTATVTNFVAPTQLDLRAEGDFVGRGEWRLSQRGELTDVRFDWHITAEKPILRYFSFIAKPIFSWNHHWAMARGLERFPQEIARLEQLTK